MNSIPSLCQHSKRASDHTPSEGTTTTGVLLLKTFKIPFRKFPKAQRIESRHIRHFMFVFAAYGRIIALTTTNPVRAIDFLVRTRRPAIGCLGGRRLLFDKGGGLRGVPLACVGGGLSRQAAGTVAPASRGGCWVSCSVSWGHDRLVGC